jgi:hypothetical protein
MLKAKLCFQDNFRNRPKSRAMTITVIVAEIRVGEELATSSNGAVVPSAFATVSIIRKPIVMYNRNLNDIKTQWMFLTFFLMPQPTMPG